MPVESMKIAVVVPTLNAGSLWRAWIDGLLAQDLPLARRLVVDSGSTDATVAMAEAAGLELRKISPAEFDHGGTRQWAAGLVGECDIVVFLTQDAVLARPDSIRNLVAAFADPAVALCYGRQLPHAGASPLAAHARLFNYGEASYVRAYDDRATFGIKTAFSSNSYAAYRQQALQSVGGFPVRGIVSEDMFVAAKALKAGWKVAYCAEATVYHSHEYTLAQEFRRYFDIGVFRARNRWIYDEFGEAGGEGARFVRSEMAFLLRHGRLALLPVALVRTAFKLLGFRLGSIEHWMPPGLKRRLSLHRRFWG